MASRSYDDGCGIAHALDLVGERWALLVVRELLLGPKRFTDLRAGLPASAPTSSPSDCANSKTPGVSCAAGCRRPPAPGLRADGVGPRARAGGPPARPLGHPVTTLPRDAPIGVDSVILSLRARFDPKAAGASTPSTSCGWRYRFRAVVDDGRIDLARGTSERADAVIETTPRQLDSMVSGELPMTRSSRRPAAPRSRATLPRPNASRRSSRRADRRGGGGDRVSAGRSSIEQGCHVYDEMTAVPSIDPCGALARRREKSTWMISEWRPASAPSSTRTSHHRLATTADALLPCWPRSGW